MTKHWCPKDADQNHREKCPISWKLQGERGIYVLSCTRKKGHKGKHHCHTEDKTCRGIL